MFQMINLDVEDYCQDCDEFEPCGERICYEDMASFNRYVEQRVTCEHKNMCRRLVKYLQRKVDAGGESTNEREEN